MNTINVKYVGKKPFAIDNVARSGRTWTGAGDVQPVTPTQAKRLIAYPDQWQLENIDDLVAVNQPATITTADDDGAKVETNADDLDQPPEKMTATQLVALAKHKYGKTLHLRVGKKVLLDELTDIIKNNDPIA